jgi:hypothetical protein
MKIPVNFLAREEEKEESTGNLAILCYDIFAGLVFSVPE